MATGTPAHEFRELDNAELETKVKELFLRILQAGFQFSVVELTELVAGGTGCN